MIIEKATLNNIDEIMDIYSHARSFMAEHNNPTQWGTLYPPRTLVEDMINDTYLCVHEGKIAAVFYFAIENDPTYDVIYNGAWKNDSKYGVIHRIASSHIAKGAARFCINWAFEQCGNLKIDTHENNIPMQNLLKSLGFSYCGIIYCNRSGDERLAYQKTS